MIEPGTPVTFAHRSSRVVGYVIRVEECVRGHAAVCMGLLVQPELDTGWPQASMRWRVPVADLTTLPISGAK